MIENLGNEMKVNETVSAANPIPSMLDFIPEKLKDDFEMQLSLYEHKALEIKEKAAEIAKETAERRPDLAYENACGVDQLMLKAISYLEEFEIDTEMDKKIYPKLWEQARNSISPYVQSLNDYMIAMIALMLEGFIRVDEKHPAQPVDERPELSAEEKEKRMINAERVPLPNILKNPLTAPDDKIIDLSYEVKKLDKEAAIDATIKAIKPFYDGLYNKAMPEDMEKYLKETLTRSTEFDAYFKEGTLSMNQLDELFVKVGEEYKSVAGIKELDDDINNILQSVRWYIWVMPKPLEQQMMQLLRAQQQMAARQQLQEHMDSMNAVKGASVTPKGGKGPGNLRAFRGSKK